jgi:hypothetical protein
VLTNKPVYGVPDAKLREQCWRFEGLAEALEGTKGNMDWRAGLKMLRDASQKGTTWSVDYALPNRQLYFSVYQNWETIDHHHAVLTRVTRLSNRRRSRP